MLQNPLCITTLTVQVKVSQGCVIAVSVRWCLLCDDFPDGKRVEKKKCSFLDSAAEGSSSENSKEKTQEAKLLTQWKKWS